MECPCGEVEDGAKRYGDDCADEADDIVRHGEVGGWEGHQEGFRVQPQHCQTREREGRGGGGGGD